MRADEAAGRTGSPMLHEGNIVRAGGTSDSTLVVINQIQPVYVSFTVPRWGWVSPVGVARTSSVPSAM